MGFILRTPHLLVLQHAKPLPPESIQKNCHLRRWDSFLSESLDLPEKRWEIFKFNFEINLNTVVFALYALYVFSISDLCTVHHPTMTTSIKLMLIENDCC